MFESSEVDVGWERSALRPKDPPELVEVDTGLVLPPRRLRWGTETPIWARSAGIGGAVVEGRLLSQALSVCGDWWALVDFTMVSRNGRTIVSVQQLVDPAAVRRLGTE